MKIGTEEVIFSETPIKDILETFSMGEIFKDGSVQNDKRNITLKYASEEIKKQINEQKNKCNPIIDWEVIHYHDNSAELLKLICERIDTDNENIKTILTEKIMEKIEDNIYLYFKKYFDNKIDDSVDHYQQYGCFDYFAI